MMLTAAAAVASLALAKPNVVLFLVDDLGWQDTALKLGLPDKLVGRHFRTPNLERLAARGVQVTQAYASCPVCTPSRVALLTGRNPARSHITSWVLDGRDTGAAYAGLTLPDWAAEGLQPGQAPTLAERFRAGGYRTIQIGKAHFAAGRTQGADPTNLGFDLSIAGSAAGHPSSYYGTENFAAPKASPTDPPRHNDVPDLEAYHGKDVYLEEALAREAVREIAANAKTGKPLFLWYAPYAVHTPIQPNRRLLGRYAGIDPIEGAYATMVESVDNALGALMRALARAGQLENTIIAFTSDNGGLSESSRGGYLNLHNLPLKSGKGSAYEGGTRVPFAIAGPGIASGATLGRTPMDSADLFATLADLAGLGSAADDGQSFAEAFRKGADERRARPLVWHFPHNRGSNGPGLEPFSSIRVGAFKAIYFYGPRRWELYNLETDLGETHDLSSKNRPKLKELAEALRSELRSMGAQFPSDAASGKAVEPILG